MVGLNLGLGLSKSKSKYSSQSSGQSSGQSQGARTPIVPGGWGANYSRLGKSIGFGQTGPAVNPGYGAPRNPRAFTPSYDPATDPNIQQRTVGVYDPSLGYNPSDQADQNAPRPATQSDAIYGGVIGDERYTGDGGSFPDDGTGADMPYSGSPGLTADQAAGADILRRRTLPGQNRAINDLNFGQERMNQGANAYEGLWNDEINPALKQGPHLLGEGPGAVDNVTARQGSQFRKDYMDPYLNEVVDATGADLEEQFNRAVNRAKMGAATGGAFGGRGLNSMIGQTTDDYLRNRASTLGGLRSGGFQFATGAGMQDADRFLTADQTNQQARLEEARRMDERQRFDVGSRYQTDADRRALIDQAMKGVEGATGLRKDAVKMGVDASDEEKDAAVSLFESGQISFEQLMAFLNGGLNLFGEEESGQESGTESSTKSGKASGTKISADIGYGE